MNVDISRHFVTWGEILILIRSALIYQDKDYLSAHRNNSGNMPVYSFFHSPLYTRTQLEHKSNKKPEYG